jgi:hypothetical protein
MIGTKQCYIYARTAKVEDGSAGKYLWLLTRWRFVYFEVVDMHLAPEIQGTCGDATGFRESRIGQSARERR